MAYIKTNWKDHAVEHPGRFNQQSAGEGKVTLTPDFGQVLQQGVPVDATNLNHLEQGVKDCDDAVIKLKQTSDADHAYIEKLKKAVQVSDTAVDMQGKYLDNAKFR